MIKIFIPQEKSKGKTEARGFWLDNGKIYYDYLTIETLPDSIKSPELTERLEHIRKEYNQEAVFFVKNNLGYVYRHRFNFLQLPNRIYKEVKSLKPEIKEALHKYNGVTIYKVNGKYFKEIYY
jgi:hypothetical protein